MAWVWIDDEQTKKERKEAKKRQKKKEKLRKKLAELEAEDGFEEVSLGEELADSLIGIADNIVDFADRLADGLNRPRYRRRKQSTLENIHPLHQAARIPNVW